MTYLQRICSTLAAIQDDVGGQTSHEGQRSAKHDEVRGQTSDQCQRSTLFDDTLSTWRTSDSKLLKI